ncbi:MAG: clostripain-related cysteine peptidase [Bacillota bacterium]
MAKRFILSLMAIALIIFNGGCFYAPKKGAVEGYILVDPANSRSMLARGIIDELPGMSPAAVAGAYVAAYTGGIGGAFAGGSYTNSSGYFMIAQLVPGTYGITVTCSGFTQLDISMVDVLSGVRISVNDNNMTIPRKRWNFLVYMDGDNNAESYAIADLNEMETVGSTADINVIVILDRSPSYDTSNGNWSGTKIFYVTPDGGSDVINSTVMASYNELDMGDPQTLTDFIVYCQTRCPADYTCLTLWNHGSGTWGKAASRRAARGICFDDTDGTYLTADNVQTALYNARNTAGCSKINILNTNACVMQMLEMAYEWRAETDYLTGSENFVLATGSDYEILLGHLAGNPAMLPDGLAATIVNDFGTAQAGGNYTYSALKLNGTEFTNLFNAFGAFASSLNSIPLSNITEWDIIVDARNNAIYMYYDLENLPEFRDLYYFASYLSTSSTDVNVRSAAAALLGTIDAAVLARVQGGTHLDTRGIAITLTNNITWPLYAADYPSFESSTATLWDEFLDNLAVYTTP